MLVTYVAINKDVVSVVTNGKAGSAELAIKHKAEVDRYLQVNEGATIVAKDISLKHVPSEVLKTRNSNFSGAFLPKSVVQKNKLTMQRNRALNKLKQQLQPSAPINPEIVAWNKAVEEKRKKAKQAKIDKILSNVQQFTTD